MRWGVLSLLCILSLVGGGEAHAQSAVDPEEVIQRQTTETGSGRLTDTVAPSITRARQRLDDDFGLSFGAIYTGYAQAESSTDTSIANGNIGLAARWEFARRGRPDASLIFGYLENRHNYTSSNAFDFRRSNDSLWLTNPIPSDGHTRLRQLHLKQSLFDNQVTFGVGKFSIRGAWNRSKYLGSNTRDFLSFPLSFGAGLSSPIDTTGVATRIQPTDLRATLMLGAYDDDPPDDGFAVSFSEPFIIGELMLSSEHWKPDIDVGRQPDTVLRLTTYRRPQRTDRDAGFGVSLSFDQQLHERIGLGLRYDYAEQAIGLLNHVVSAGVVLSGPGDRTRDGAGFGLTWAQSNTINEEQFGMEAFYRFNISPGLELSPDIQLLAGGTDDKGVRLIGGLRFNLAL